ncbi:MAG TPA: hypothetical protein DC017_18575 [Candidatus Wallbacteria bacterium]|nr:hypothetical protein [Candidatus Wallbacteria bacterium]
MKKDLTNQIVWSDIATAYEKAVVRTSFYDNLMKKLMTQLKGRKKILDLGCGVGYLINELMKEDPSRTIVGVDANEYMLEIARKNVIEDRFSKKVTLIHGDAVTFEYHEKFDAVVSSNLLFNLKTPYAFLDNAYANLKPGGRFVLTSAKRDPDLGLAIRTMKEEFKADGRFDSLEKYASVAEEVNSRFLGEMKTFSNAEIEKVLTDFIGFRKVVSNQNGYLDQNFVVAADKPKKEGEIIYKIANENERLQAYNLRYHILHDRYEFIDPNETRIEKTSHDDHAIHFVAIDPITDRVVGCLFYLEYDENVGFPAENEIEIDYFLNMHSKLATPGRWYVLPTYRHRGIGKKLFELYFKTCVKSSVTGTVFCINPENKGFFEKLGAKKIGEINSNYSEFRKPAQAMPVYIDLSAGMPAYFSGNTKEKKIKITQ